MIIQSRNIVNDIKFSGIEYNGKSYNSLPGFNIFTIHNGIISLKNFSTMNELITYIRYTLSTNIKYIVGLMDANMVGNFNAHKLVIKVPVLRLVKISQWIQGGTYYFLFDNANKNLLSEKISNNSLVADTYKYKNGILSRTQNKYIVYDEKAYRYFSEYFKSFAKKLDLIAIRVPDISLFDYINDPNEVYIFIVRHFVNKQCTKKIFNFEQASRESIRSSLVPIINTHIPLFDYSIENIQYYNASHYLPYQYNEKEVSKLNKYYKTIPKQYDVAFCGDKSNRRIKILDALKKMGLKVLMIRGWGNERDMKIASCKVLINIHFDDEYTVYESLRCDRWAFAQMPVISEDSPHHNLLDVKIHNIVYFCPYKELANKTYKLVHNLTPPSLSNITTVKNIRSTILDNLVSQNKL